MKKYPLFSDITALIFAFFFAYYLRNKGLSLFFFSHVQPLEIYIKALPFAVVVLLIIFHSFSLYTIRGRETTLLELYNLLKAIMLWLISLMAMAYLVKYDYSRIILFLFGLSTLFFILIGRLLLRRFALLGQELNVAVFGQGKAVNDIIEKFQRLRQLGYHFAGQILRKDSKQINSFLKRKNIDELWIIDSMLTNESLLKLVATINKPQIAIRVYSNFFQPVMIPITSDDIDSFPTLQLSKIKLGKWQTRLKRIMDIVLSSILLIVTLPLWGLIAMVIKLNSNGPAIFRQKRIGYQGNPFMVYKFRTMIKETNPFSIAPVNSSDPRVTKIGRWLRRTSLDELPQLINIIKGEMSLVGPRPEMPFIVKRYKSWQKMRLEVKPGLTGLWQIVGRKDLPLQKHLEYDFYYITNQSLLFDMAILLKTIFYVALGKGAY